MKFIDILTESPWLEFLKGKTVDLKRETHGTDWIYNVLPKIFKKHRGKEKEISERLIFNVSFMGLFKKDFNSLTQSEQLKARHKLPKVFWELYEKKV